MPSHFGRYSMQYRARGGLLVEPKLDMLTEQLAGMHDEVVQELEIWCLVDSG